MIVDTLEHAARYEPVSPLIAAGLAYLAAFDPATEDGKYEIAGQQIVAVVQSYDTSPATDKRFEAHREHIDIQFIVAGRERILHADTAGLTVETEYNAAKDVEFYRDPEASSSLLLTPGSFAIFFPHDAHKPGCMAGGRDAVRKVVVKVEV
jgi:biofilm protein TabA